MNEGPIDVVISGRDVVHAISCIVDAVKEHNIEKLRNETERERIRAYLTVLSREIASHTAVTLKTIDNIFNERAWYYDTIDRLISVGAQLNDIEMVRMGCDCLKGLYSVPPEIANLLSPTPDVRRRLMTRNE
jgi:hypothetical protein